MPFYILEPVIAAVSCVSVIQCSFGSTLQCLLAIPLVKVQRKIYVQLLHETIKPVPTH